MGRHHAGKRRTAVRNGIDLHGQTAAASALATGCLAVVALSKTAAANAAARDATRR